MKWAKSMACASLTNEKARVVTPATPVLDVICVSEEILGIVVLTLSDGTLHSLTYEQLRTLRDISH